MTNLTGTITRSIPSEVEGDEPTQVGVNALLWLVEVDTETPAVSVLQVIEGAIQPNDVPSGQYRFNGEYTEGGVQPLPTLVEQDGKIGVYRDVTVGVVYDEDGEIVDPGTVESQWFPVVDGGGAGPVIIIPDPAPDTMEFNEARTQYQPPMEEETSE